MNTPKKMLEWKFDEATAQCTRRLQIPGRILKRAQFQGYLNARNWKHRITSPDFPAFCYVNEYQIARNPQTITQCFREELMLEGLALTVGWGKMWRKHDTVYRIPLYEIDAVLRSCATSLEQTSSVEHAWKLCIDKLHWTDTMTSKTLHFIARSQGYEINSGVAIDSKMRTKFAGHYDKHIEAQLNISSRTLGIWSDMSSAESSWTSYNRYMTAICCLAEMKNWTTTEVEATIFQDPIGFLGPI